MKKILFTITAFIAISCQQETGTVNNPPDEVENPAPTERPIVVYSDLDRRIAQGNNTFALNLLRAVQNSETPGTNIILSPLSAAIALAMTANGASGQTLDEIQTALGYGDVTPDQMNDYFAKLITTMTAADPDVTFQLANSIWIHQTFPVLKPFVETNSNVFDAEIRNVDMQDPATVGLINQWCAQKTQDKIRDILTETQGIMYLINALYFKATWLVPFEKEATADADFHNADGAITRVPTMVRGRMNARYLEADRYRLLDLSYGNRNEQRESTFSMTILLPDDDTPLDDLIPTLDAATLETNFSKMAYNTVYLRLPKFELAYKNTLNQALNAMGISEAFNPDKANFKLINATTQLYINNVIQQTFVKVDEAGTEAAAVTVVEMITAGIDTTTDFHVDRPFLYFIREKNSGAIIFTGIMHSIAK
jgi:serpin B